MDGKSTTTWILYSILQKCFFGKKNVFLSGNFEIPFSATVTTILEKNISEGIIVTEISSFMSYAIKKFSPDYTIFTNLKTDHLNWHADLQEYVDSKMNLIEKTSQKSILNQEIFDFIYQEQLHINSLPQEKIVLFSEKKSLNYTDGENIFLDNEKIFSLQETHFSGKHNAMNILSVLLLLKAMHLDFEKIFPIFQELH